ncbi:MAG TPA: dTDP-4-dehydrorhamnose 3,5-epimerase [Salinivirgaceae bacterium]|nr:dTDP-4-dehydrorhamnose 3,5-epimerase [Salinivirgaceae bacterium]
MNVRQTNFPGLLIIEPNVFKDHRGYFFESYSHRKFEENGISTRFVQDNQAKSVYGVVRGLHYQQPPHAQAKLVRVTEGTILDVVIDLRVGSPTFGRYFSIELSADNFLALYIPKGFAHGYSVLSPTAVVTYKANDFYAPQAEAGINIFDPKINIDWKIPHEKLIVSDRDKIWPMFDTAPKPFVFDPVNPI